MAISADTSTKSISTGYSGSGSFTWSHTCTGASLLIVAVSLWQDVAGTGTVTAMTYNGTSMTKANAITNVAMRAEIWYLLSPAAGTNTVSATVTGDTDQRGFVSSSWIGTATSSVLDTANAGTTGSASPITGSVTPTTSNALVIDAASRYGTAAVTKGGSQTLLQSDVTGSTTTASSYLIAGAPSAQTLSWTTTGSNDWAHVVASFKENPLNSGFFLLF